MFPWQQIKDQNNIVDVIGEYLQITQKSSNYVAICPFHDDKNPSLTISPDKQIWHCFGCGAGGDCFGFVSQIESISKYEAAVKLAKKVNFKLSKENLSNKITNSPKIFENQIKNNSTKIAKNQIQSANSSLTKSTPNTVLTTDLQNLDNSETLQNDNQNINKNPIFNSSQKPIQNKNQNVNIPTSDYQKGLQYLSLAKRLYHQNLLQIIENPKHFVAIYCQKRGLTLDIIQKFEIGFAGVNCDILKLAKKYNLDQKILLQTGLLKKIDKKTLTKKE